MFALQTINLGFGTISTKTAEEHKEDLKSPEVRLIDHSNTTQNNINSPQRKERLEPLSVTNTESAVEAKRRVLYRKIMKINAKDYLVEVSKTKKKYYVIAIR